MLIRSSLEALSLGASGAVLTNAWDAWLADLGHAFDATKAYLVPMPMPDYCSPIPGAVLGYTPAQRLLYYEQFAAIDVLRKRIIQHRSMQGYTSQMLVHDDEYLKSTVFNEFALPNGSRYVLGILLDVGPSSRYVLGCARPADGKDFSPSDVRALERLAPFVRQSLRLDFLLSGSRRRLDISNSILEQLTVGILLLTSDLRIVFSNQAASHMLNAADHIAAHQGRLFAPERQSSRRLEDAAGLVLSGSCEEVVIQLRGTAAPNGSHVSAVFTVCSRRQNTIIDLCATEPAIAVFLSASHPSASLSPNHLAAGLDLSCREANVASMLVGGASLTEIASDLGISREGVRYHLKRLFWKTGSHSQQELVRTITRLSTPLSVWTNASQKN